jgi:N utilization substance protein A
VEIKSIAREPGSRTKIAVASNDEAIDPIGAMVGQKGTRVSSVIQELGGEKIDIVNWSDDPAKFITNALLPAKITDVEIRPGHEARAYVPPDQLSLAIGKGGQNVRLAARLTGWKIEIRSSIKPEEAVEGGVAEAEETASSEVSEIGEINEAGQKNEIDALPVGQKMKEALMRAGFDTIDKLANAGVEDLTKVKGIGEKTANKILESARSLKSK